MYDRLIKEMVGSAGSGLVSLHMRDLFPDGPFAISKKLLTLGGAKSPVSGAISARASRIKKIKNRVNVMGIMISGCQID